MFTDVQVCGQTPVIQKQGRDIVMGFRMERSIEGRNSFGNSIKQTYWNMLVLLLLQFLFRFAQGQGPGQLQDTYFFSVKENQTAGTEVGQITHTAQPFYTYTFEGSIAGNYFNLDQNTGRITTKIVLDREEPVFNNYLTKDGNFSILVLAESSSGDKKPVEVYIGIIDINDNSPFFPSKEINVTFSENSPIGFRKRIPQAQDDDEGQNANITQYRIISGEGPFELVYDPGEFGEVLFVQTNAELDRETVSSYVLTISAQDQGQIPNFGTAVLKITVSDVNDNPPIFAPTTFNGQVNETDPVGTLVVEVVATDRDAGQNQDITYTILDDSTEANQFRIDPDTGSIYTTTEPLVCDKGKCLLQVEARDGGEPYYLGRAYVYITVYDVNNHDPEINIIYYPEGNKGYSSVNEDARDKEIVAYIQATDKDLGVFGKTNVRVVSGNELKHFSFEIPPSPGIFLIRVNGDGVLDRERQSVYNLTLEATDSGNPPRTSHASLLIYVNDINEFAPEFVNKRVQLSISETTDINSFVSSMLAIDKDDGINAKLTYKIESGNELGWFHIDEDTGLVTVKQKLQYEIQNYFKLNISVHDGASNPFYDYSELEITMWDENDMAPTFQPSAIYTVSLTENLASVAPVVTTSAIDNDSGLNGTITYRFHPHVQDDYPDKFFLDSNTGEITTRKLLDREELSHYTILVLAQDQGTPALTSTATVNLEINDVNDNVPVFYPTTYYAKVFEGQDIGHEVTTVSATDLDAGDNGQITYSFLSDNFAKFKIDEATGLITTTTVLRKSDGSSYTLAVLATDKPGNQSQQATVIVSVLSVVDRQPYFVVDDYNFLIPEDPSSSPTQYIGDVVGTVEAMSDNPGTLIQYHIQAGDPDSLFTLDGSSGIIRRAKSIDREVYASFSLEVVATAGDMFAMTVVKVSVRDSNDNAPSFKYPVVDFDLLEDRPIGHHIYRFNATDPDETGPNSRIIYSLQNDFNGVFSLEATTGVLILDKAIKLLASKMVSLTVTARDSAPQPFTTTQELRLTVKDVNNHSPRFPQTTYELSLIESQAVNTKFLDLKATDNDEGANAAMTFNITRGNEDRKFGVFPDGNLFIAKELDRETKDLYKLTVRAVDKGHPPRSSECNITIHISDYNDNKPIFLNATYSFNVQENTAAGAFVGYVKAADSDMGRNAELLYYFKNNVHGFNIDAQTGELSTNQVFDREMLKDTDYTITFDVSAKDNGQFRLENVATVRIHILDDNDNAPVFRQPIYKVTVFENAAVFSNVTVVKADDPDDGINAIVTYRILDGNSDNNFEIIPTTGQIMLKRTLDRETLDHYHLHVEATDSGVDVRHSATTLVKITVGDINDNFPLFPQTHLDISVREDTDIGTMVAHFPASDIDLGVNGEITYSLSGIDDDGTFGIDKHTGKIYLLKELDYEHQQSFRLNVTATDNGNPKLPYYIRFSITIEDVNDNPPQFQDEPLIFRITEHSSNIQVSTVKAVDIDSGKNGEVRYSLSYQDPPSDHFKIVQATGLIYLEKQIDREEASLYRLMVAATDQAVNASLRQSSETEVLIYVEDMNDNRPQVLSFDTIAVPRLTPANEYITTIKAYDPDEGENGQISLQLIQDGSRFTLDSNTGRFFLSKAQLPATAIKYSVRVQVSDYGQSPLDNQFDMNIIVTDDAQGPVFQSASYSGVVAENSDEGTVVLSVNAVSQFNSKVEYYVTNITRSNTGVEAGRYFKVDKTTGILSTAEVLDREEIGSEFDVEIYAIDVDGATPRTNSIKARVQVSDVNDTPPKFSKNFYTIDVPEDIQVDSTIITLVFSDDDTLGGLKLTLNQESSTNLRIDQNGSLITTGTLDREKQERYTVTVTATDGIQSTSCQVQINLLDVNDNAPQFSQPFYSIDVDEDTALGTTIGGVRAGDPDDGENGHVTYFMTSAWANETFLLDPVMGNFVLRSVIDFEQNRMYALVVRAKDDGDPAQTSSVTVYINVKDVNDNTPVFEHGIYEPAIFENVTVGTSVLQVLATDLDSGINGDIEYTISEGDLEGHFSIDAEDGTIYTAALLDRETASSYTLTIQATDKAANVDERRSSNTEVVISLRDVNDYTPEFVSPPTIFVKENLPRNTVVHTFTVRDLDEGINGEIRYTILSQTGGTPFTVGVSDGQLRVNADLDRESAQNYTLQIEATDRGVPPLSTSQVVNIVIDDENDNSPIFNPTSYTYTVAENMEIGTTLVQVSATDLDIGLNGIVSYFIIGGDDNFDFYMDQSSGVLRIQKSLDFERVQKYDLVIQAEDSGDGTKYANATITVTILDVNDNAPVFLDSPYIGFVRENMDVEAVHVLQVSAYDADSPPFNQLNYMIREGNRDVFNMSMSSGEIMALKKLDREETAEYTLTVVATDSTSGRGLTGSGTVSVYVEDVNDNPPIFERAGTYVAHILENATINTEVIMIKATDKDEGVNAQIIYSLVDSQNNMFTIYPDTGVVTTQAMLDRETMPQYTLEIVAMDTSMLPLSSTTTLIVYVDDVNDNPPVFEQDSYDRTMLVPVSIGNFVCGATATDVDIGDNSKIVYSLRQPDATRFRIDPVRGVVTVGDTLTQGQTYNFQIVATDNGHPPLSAAVPVTVTLTSSSSTPPTFNTIDTNIRLTENPSLQAPVTTITAVPSVTNAPISYGIVGGNIGQSFGIEHTTGRIYVSGTVDYEVTKEFQIWVQATQSGTTSVSNYAQVVIAVDDVNDNPPQFSQTFYNASIMENYPLGSSLITVLANDPDSDNNGKVEYSLDGPDSSKFKIDRNSGRIITFTSLDREDLDSYSLIVVATDKGSPAKSSTASVRVNVLDANDNSPMFTRQFRIKIPENMEVGSFVIHITTSDDDIGINAIAKYSFTDDANGTFTIETNSGNISLNKPLDAEKNKNYNLRVRASDGANVVLGNVEVEISDVNDNSPVILQPYSFNFPEMSPTGSFIGQLRATDRDVEEPNNKVYFVLKLASGFFHLDSDTGRLTSLEMLYFDPSVPPTSPPNRHELLVVARDLGTPVQSSERLIHINIMDFNDHAPVFEKSSYRSAVPDNALVEGSIIQVVARDDLDYGDNAMVEYFLTGGDGQNFFHVNRFSGIVSVGSSLSGHRNREYTIIVKAEDKGTPPQSTTVNVTLVVTDINIHPPKFADNTASERTIDENVGVGSTIYTFQATDDDSSMNAEVYFEIIGGNEDGLFDLNMETGVLTVKEPLDYELAHQHVLNISATDRALYSKHVTIGFTVKLNDVNDNDPIFRTTEDRVFVEENTPVDTSVYEASAADADSGVHAKIHYALVGDAEAQGKFRIDDETGILYVKGGLDYESTTRYSITIMALNPDSSRKSTMSLTVHIEGVNEFVPAFVKDTYYFSISESAPTKTSVGLVSATDDDAGEDGIVYFFLVGDSNAKGFKVDARTGVISVSAQPDYENSNSITLKVLAKNWGSVKGNDFDTCVVHISVEDANDAPRFSEDIYTANIMEKSGSDVSVITVSAEDTDFEIADRTFSYLILDGNIGNAFKIDSQTGFISTTGNVELDREVIAVYNLTVGARDTGNPPQTGSAQVQIYLDPYRAICGDTFCEHGGVCVNDACQCPSTWTGSGCTTDVNECDNNICRQGSTCQNLLGSFKCHCPLGLTGTYCENVENFCQSSPCVKGNCENTIHGYMCVCPYGYWGTNCQFNSTGFQTGSYMEFTTLNQVNEIDVTFATLKSNALLMYNPSSLTGSSEFVALEVVGGLVRFSIAVTGGNTVRISTSTRVNTGEWYKVKVTKDYNVYTLEVRRCPEDRAECEDCQTGSCTSQGQIPANQVLDLGTHPLLVGGVKDMSAILSQPGQVSSHDFVGCVQGFIINGADKLQETPTDSLGDFSKCPRSSNEDVCLAQPCLNGGTCTTQWEGALCQCTAKYSGNTCEKELQPFGFASDAFVKVSMKEDVRRDSQLAAINSRRRRRAVTTSSVMVRFRITADSGVLVFASTTDANGSKYTLLSVIDRKLSFTSNQYGRLETVSMEQPTVSDGNWHNATVTITADTVQIRLDGLYSETLYMEVFFYNSLDVKEIILGGASSSVPVGNTSLKDFGGCISVFKLDGNELPMNGTTDVYNIEIVGGVSNGCSALCGGGACEGNGCTVNGEAVVCSIADDTDSVLSIGIIVVIVFFALVIVGIIIVFIVFRQRRRLCMKTKEHTKQNGTNISKSANSSGHSHQDSGYGENNIDELIIRNHIAQELAHNKFHSPSNGRLMTPDIIESDISRHPMPLEIEDGTVIIDNASDLTHLRDLNGDMPEHYDLENASSIAPSDIDIIDHYRHFHDGRRPKHKNKSHSNHSHSNSQHSSKHHHSNHSNHHSHMMRDSPNLLTSVPYLNDLARGSPHSRVSHSPVNQLSRQSPNVRQSPLTNINMKGMPVTDLNNGSRTQSERSLASHRSKSSTPNKPKRQMLPNGPQKKISNNNYENKQFLTVEEVERLNARPRQSPASLQEAVSTSSENNTRKMGQKPFDRYQDTSVLLEPPESSSDDSANDSFTCSEFEYDNEKQKNDFDPTRRIFSNLPEADVEEDGAYHNKTFKSDGLDSGGNSFSSNKDSSDEGQSKSKSLNNAFNWDDLLNWGPKFEKLVGVFTDIALLPDADSPGFGETDGKTGDREEYV